MSSSSQMQMRTTTQAMRNAAALNQKQQQKAVTEKFAGIDQSTAALSPLGVVADGISKAASEVASMASAAVTDYFGIANWTNSPLPTVAANGTVTGGMHKFVDTLPGLGPTGANDLGQYISLGVPDTTTFAGNKTLNPSVVAADYYEIGLVEYREQLHKDLPLPGTKLRGYVQLYPLGTASAPSASAFQLTKANGITNDVIDPTTGAARWAYGKPQYLGPTLLAVKDRPVRVKFTNLLPTGPAGYLFIPVDHTYMGAGMGPNQSIQEINVTNAGAGYTSDPTVNFNNTGTGGTGGAAVANVLNGTVVSITVTNGGSGYTKAPVITLSGGGATTVATATAVITSPDPMENYAENRATLHLHGGNTPWISDGTPHQWTTPQGELTSYSKGESVSYVPDMWFDASGKLIPSCAEALTCAVAGATNDPGPGSLTFYWTNQQTGRLLFYHDHAYGETRLNVYAGEAAGYLIVDPVEEAQLAAQGIPGTVRNPANLADPVNDLKHLIPLIIQDKTFVPDNGAAGGQLAATDPTWDLTKWGGAGDLWLPHVWVPNQNPADISGANAYGRWDYGPWFWPAQDPSTFVPSGQPYQCTSSFYNGTAGPAFPPLICPGIPNPSGVMEAMMDTPVINGTAYPSLTVDPTAYRFPILPAGNDRAWNLGLYVAEPLTVGVLDGGAGYNATTPPAVTINPSNGATATAIISNGGVTDIKLTNVGKGYTTAPAVTISAPATGGVQATAVAVVDPITGTILSVKVINGGSLYTSATVTIGAPTSGCAINTTTCVNALAIATVTPPGSVMGVNLTVPANVTWAAIPTVTVAAPPAGGKQAYLIASINSEVKMVDAAPHTSTSAVPLCNDVNQLSGANLVLGLTDGNGNPLNGTGLPANCWPTSWPTDGRDGGVPDPLTAGPAIVQIGNESGLLPNPVVIPSTPVGYEYNRKSITVLNIFNHGLFIGPAQRAEILIDFSQFAGKTLILYNDGPAPVPAFDPRNDYYTGDEDQTMSGGAPSTLPGYGPNTRTIMQIKVNAVAGGTAGTGSAVTALTLTSNGSGYTTPSVTIAAPTTGTQATASVTGSVSGLKLTSTGSGYTNPQVSFAGSGAGAAATLTGSINSLSLTNGGAGYSSAPTVSFTGGAGSLATATSTVSVTGVTLVGGGAGYSAAPAVSIADTAPGTGTGATASATVSVTSITALVGGAGYTAAPTVAINNTGGAPTTVATAKASMSVTGFTGLVGGSGYTSAPTVAVNDTGTPTTVATAKATISVTGLTFTASTAACAIPTTATVADTGTGTGATVTVTQDVNGFVTAVALATPGAKYTAPSVVFSPAGCTATAAVSGAVDSLAIVTTGAGYTAPSVVFSGGGAGTGAGATATGAVDKVTITLAGAGYTAPAVVFTGAATTPATASTAGAVDALKFGTAGAHYSKPVVSFTGAATTAATATTTGVVDSLTLTSQGTGYTAPIAVSFSGGGTPTTSAAATATVAFTSLTLVSGGSGYTTAPTVTITDTAPGTGTGAAATATLSVTGITLTNPGSGYITPPVVTISDTGTGTGAAASASFAKLAQFSLGPLEAAQLGMFQTIQNAPVVPEPTNSAPTTPPAYARIQDTSITGWYGGGIGSITTTLGSGYGSAPTITVSAPNRANGVQATIGVSFTGGNVTGITLTNGGAGYSSTPTVVFSGGNGAGAAATAVMNFGIGKITITNGGAGYAFAPSVTISAPPFGGVRATATATISGGAVTAINVTNAGSGYTTAPTITISAPFIGVRATATTVLSGRVASLILTNGGSGYSSAPTIAFTGGGTPTTSAAATAAIKVGAITAITLTNPGFGYTALPTVTITGGNPTTPATVTLLPPANPFMPKAIQELFTLDYGRMNATFGVEVPFTNFFNQTTIPYGYIDPPTEMFQSGDTVFWKITHNGVDTHFIHFHLFDVQVINRVGWDGMIKPPDANEVGWLDTVRMNPLEDIVVAMRPMRQVLPWSLPNSVRPLDVTMPIGMSNANNAPGFTNIDTQNNPVTITNDIVNFGWEYVWHCHILEHEEIDMMRPMDLAIAPEAPTNVTLTRLGTGNGQRVQVSWKDNSINETGFTIQRATNLNGPWVSFSVPAMPGKGKTINYVDRSVARRTTYYYQVIANNLVGYTQTVAGTAASIPTLSADSPAVLAAAPVSILSSADDVAFSDSFETGLSEWGAMVGDVETLDKAVAGPYGGKLGLAVKLSDQPAYVAKDLAAAAASFTTSFYFDPNGAISDSPIDVFQALDKNGLPIFGVQFQSLSATDYQVRAWVMQGGELVYTDWTKYIFEEKEDAKHNALKIDLTWESGAKGGFNFYVDDDLKSLLNGDTSAYQVQAVVLGSSSISSAAASSLSAAASGTLYFDEFSSSNINAVQQPFQIFMPSLLRQ